MPDVLHQCESAESKSYTSNLEQPGGKVGKNSTHEGVWVSKSNLLASRWEATLLTADATVSFLELEHCPPEVGRIIFQDQRQLTPLR